MRLVVSAALAAAVFGLIHFYLWWRLVRSTTRPGRWRRAGAVAVVVLALLVPLAFFGSRTVHGLAWPGYLWLGLMFYLLLVLLLLELPMLVLRRLLRRRAPAAPVPVPAAAVTASDEAGTTTPPPAGSPEGGPDGAAKPAGYCPDRRLLLARGAAIFAGLTAAGVTGYGVHTAVSPPRLKRVRVSLSKLDRRADGYRIALVSDIHLGPMRGARQAERIVAMINQLDAHLVAVVGDLVDGTVGELGAAATPLRELRSRDGSYFVTGNHEYYSGYQEWVDEVARLGMRPLRNERVELAGFDLAGVNDLGGEEFGDGPDFDRALDGRDSSRPVILLAHQPVQVHEAARHGVDLQLSGHTHGGQMFPIHLLVGLEQPVRSGLATVDGTQIYVTNGAGFWGPPLRVGAAPEITLVELRAG
ncbi:MAG: metallophosphoesterase [Micromonosporaceae bacterium]|nr:metallophosphoesterase [Micromonosporaceae bacterium]